MTSDNSERSFPNLAGDPTDSQQIKITKSAIVHHEQRGGGPGPVTLYRAPHRVARPSPAAKRVSALRVTIVAASCLKQLPALTFASENPLHKIYAATAKNLLALSSSIGVGVSKNGCG